MIREYLHQPLQSAKLHALHPFPQPRHLLLDPGLRLLNLQLLHVGLLPDPALFQVQIQSHTRLRAADLVPQAGIQLGKVVGEALVGGAREEGLGGVGGEELGAEFSEVDFLSVCGAFGVFVGEEGLEGV